MESKRHRSLTNALYAAIFGLIGLQVVDVLVRNTTYLFHALALQKAELQLSVMIFLLLTGAAFFCFDVFSESIPQTVVPVWGMFYLSLISVKSGNLAIAVGSWLICLTIFSYLWRQLAANQEFSSRQLRFWRLVSGTLLGLQSACVLLLAVWGVASEAAKERFAPLVWKNNEQVFLLVFGGIVFVCGLIWAVTLFASLPAALDTDRSARSLRVVFLIFVFLHLAVLGLVLVGRILNLYVPTFDHGIFSQMFHNLLAGNGPVTTLERDTLLSHFAVHISPVHYLLLPVFALFPSAMTLQILQIVIVASGVIPFLMIARHFRLPKPIIYLSGILFLTNPGLIGSSQYDYHENCFLTPCLLWVLYFLLKRQMFPLLACAFVTLCIKEDAGMYLVGIGFYALTLPEQDRQQKGLIGLALIIIPLIYFFVAINLLNQYGTGSMISRYTNVIAYPELGLPGVALTLLQNATFMLSGLFRPAKLVYLLLVFLSLGFLPLLQKRWNGFVLLIPLVLINLLSDYPYQHHIAFQYHYGTSALLLFMVLLVLRDNVGSYYSMLRADKIQARRLRRRKSPLGRIAPVLNPKKIHFGWLQAKVLLLAGVAAATFISGGLLYERSGYLGNYFRQRTEIEQMKKSLDRLPRNKRLVADTFLTTYLADVESLYDIYYHHGKQVDPSADYIVVDRRFRNPQIDVLVTQYQEAGYSISQYTVESLLVLEKR